MHETTYDFYLNLYTFNEVVDDTVGKVLHDVVTLLLAHCCFVPNLAHALLNKRSLIAFGTLRTTTFTHSLSTLPTVLTPTLQTLRRND